MKKTWLLTILICLLIIAGTILVVSCPRTVAFDQCSDVYKTYAHQPGIKASFIKDFHVKNKNTVKNDTVYVDVTFLEATTDSAWAVLQDDFNAPVIPEELKELFASISTVDYWLAPKENYKLPMDTVSLNNDLITMSRKNQTICVFHLTSDSQIDNIITNKLKETSVN